MDLDLYFGANTARPGAFFMSSSQLPRGARQRARQRGKPTPIHFTLEDLAQFHLYTAALAPYGVTCALDVTHPEIPELNVVTHRGVSTFAIWRSTAGLHFRDLKVRGYCGRTAFPTPLRLWAFLAE